MAYQGKIQTMRRLTSGRQKTEKNMSLPLSLIHLIKVINLDKYRPN
jgi:hypothetical protein